MLDREDDDAAFDAKKVVVAWFGDDISDLVASLAAFAPRGSSVSVVSKERPKVKFCHSLVPQVLRIEFRLSMDDVVTTPEAALFFCSVDLSVVCHPY